MDAFALVRSRSRGFAWLPVLLFLAFVGTIFWLWQQQEHLRTTQRDSALRLEAAEHRLEALLVRQQAGDASLKQARDEINQLAQAQKALNTSLQGDHRQHWELAEVAYYVHLAERHLLLTQDVAGSRALLETADNILAQQDRNQWLTLRQAIAHDMLALKSADHIDAAGLYLRISAVADRIETLPSPLFAGRTQDPSLARITQGITPPMAANGDWRARLTALWAQGAAKFEHLISIRRTSQETAPLLDEEQRRFIKQTLHLSLAEAQLALLRHDETIYRRSLENARDTLVHYFLLADKTTYTGLQTELSALIGVDISPTLPDLSASVKAVAAAQALLGQEPPR